MNKLIRFFTFTLLIAASAGCRIPLKKPPIDPNGEIPKIDWKLLAEFAQAAADVYLPLPDLEAKYGTGSVVVRDLTGIEGRYCIFFDHERKFQTIAMRGTSNQTNVISDLNTIKVPDANLGINVHRGFKLATDPVYDDLKSLLRPEYHIRVTGHSLGGAIAVLLTMRLVKDGYVVDELLTFGQPKVTNEAGGKILTVPYFRVINDQDVVAQVPPSNLVIDLSGPFEHFGPEIVLYADKKFTYSPVHIPRDLISGNLLNNLKMDDVKDHQIQNYVDRIKALQ